MEQEHRITYKAGITRKPSDFLCGDGELAECINLATDSEELKPIVQPAVWVDQPNGANILYIHKFGDEERYIGHHVFSPSGIGDIDAYMFATRGVNPQTGVSVLTYSSFIPAENDAPLAYQAGAKITSVGKTLIIEDSNGLHYFLWKKDQNLLTDWYDFIGDTIPDPEFEFWISKKAQLNTSSTTLELDPERYADNTGDSSETLLERDSNGFPYIQKGHVEDYNDLVIGLYNKNLKSIAQKKRFAQPFAVRTALRLYDGTYTHISQPIMMFPSVNHNTFGIYMKECNSLKLVTDFGDLQFKQTKNLTEWDDIVKDVVIFVSKGVNTYDTGIDQGADTMDLVYKMQTNGIFREGSSVLSLYHSLEVSNKQYVDYLRGPITVPLINFAVSPLKERPKQEILQELKGLSLFYKIAEIGLEPVSSAKSISEYIDTHTLENLVTQDRLEYDDYFSRCKMYPNFIYSYNSRLNMANVSRGMFEGFDNFLPFDSASPYTYSFYVQIKTDARNIWVKHVKETKQKQGIYFFYPDPRAKQVTIYRGSTMVCNQKLTEHPALNGAYFMRGLPGVDVTDEVTTDSSTGAHANDDRVYNNYREPLPNYIITSEVNNPWVFKAEGYNKVGTGKIIGISSTTMALSQDAYGRTDLVVFSESGIWGMAVDNTGLYESIHPYYRDVCINPASITQIDGAVFFVSKKGLMVLTDAGVKCVSEQMNGRTFNTATLPGLNATGLQEAAVAPWTDIISTCQGTVTFLDYVRSESLFMAYDYIDSRIVMVNPNYGYAYVYNIQDGTISKTILPAAMVSAVNNYPDYLMQGNVTVNGVVQSKIYSFYAKPREEEVTARQTAFLLTRPMKLSGPVSQASLRQLMNVGTWDKGTTQAPLSKVKTEIFVSEDMVNWYQDISRFGAAARYYRLALYLSLLPTERLSGTILTEQERRANNIR